MKETHTKWLIAMELAGAILILTLALLSIYRHTAKYGFAREVSQQEKDNRLEVVSAAEAWLGTLEGFAGHEQLVQLYNSHEPLAQGYELSVDDDWCAAFGSVIAFQTGNTDIIPTECGCERQIGLWQELGRWVEDDGYVPLPGDYIYYAWDEGWSFGDCTGWADHVGIVVGTAGPFIKVIEGNYDDQVKYRTILINNYQIRGFGLPDYASK